MKILTRKEISVLVTIDTEEAFRKEYKSKEEADGIFDRFSNTLSNDEDDTEEEIEEEKDFVYTHTVSLYLLENDKIINEFVYEISDDICGDRGYYEEL